MSTYTQGMIAGVALLLIVKYLLVGVPAWNDVFHPKRNI